MLHSYCHFPPWLGLLSWHGRTKFYIHSTDKQCIQYEGCLAFVQLCSENVVYTATNED